MKNTPKYPDAKTENISQIQKLELYNLVKIFIILGVQKKNRFEKREQASEIKILKV